MQQGFRRFILCIGYHKDQVKDHFKDYSECEIIFSEEEAPLGTGGALKLAQSKIKSDIYIVHNGDSFIDLIINDMVQWFLANNLNFAIVSTKKDNTEFFGNISVDSNNRITSFEEKEISAKSEFINAGIYLIRRGHIDFSNYRSVCSIENDLIPNLMENSIYAYFSAGDFIDIGTKESYVNAKDFFDR